MSPVARLVRCVPLLLALLSAVVLGNAGEAACEMHGLGGMRGQAIAAGHHASGAQHQTPASADHHGGQGQEQEHHCCCSCISECSATVAVASAPVLPTLIVSVAIAQPRRPFHEPSSQAAPAEPDRLLPFANGPPDARSL